jgi:hypothetical protein
MWNKEAEKRTFAVAAEFEVNAGVALADVALFFDKALAALQKDGNPASKMISQARVVSVEDSTEVPDDERE